jgi:hypothetical protein
MRVRVREATGRSRAAGAQRRRRLRRGLGIAPGPLNPRQTNPNLFNRALRSADISDLFLRCVVTQ